ncbi:hypothetical protein EZV62_009098 [Acer yangbiense]|uniref:Disease resistance R13L4/SHOC-2-like LRR domain-containing protein n=1 Tax=Acer yangbiense TaxID=1000413 RepID=A0A5C7IF27_9ROSI|nr:hypothetical protein EZV62_009098 [Acer yangbiense]
MLKILDLGDAVFNQYPLGIGNLVLLRYLKINIPSLTSIPSSLCNLLNLYTLDMPSSHISEAPSDIWKMHKLGHLNFASIKLAAHPAKYCNSLENLNFISALCPSSCTEDILARLPNLLTHRIYGDLSSHQSMLSKSLAKLLCLKSLKLVNESKTPELPSTVLSEYQFPPTLTQLSLSNTELKDDPMPILEKLPNLEVLKLKHNSYMGRTLACHSGGFAQLRVLHLKSLLWLEEWIMESGAMKKLECLLINPCPCLKRLLEELWHIKTFNQMELWLPRPELKPKLREVEDMERGKKSSEFQFLDDYAPISISNDSVPVSGPCPAKTHYPSQVLTDFDIDFLETHQLPSSSQTPVNKGPQKTPTQEKPVVYSRQSKHDRVVFKPEVIQQVRDFSPGSDVQHHSNTFPSNSNEPLLESGLLPDAFVGMASLDVGMRKLGYEALGRFKDALEVMLNEYI